MKSRITYAAVALTGIIIGLTISHPVARAMEVLGITACSTAAPCTGGTNTGVGNAVKAIAANGAAVFAKNQGKDTDTTPAVYGWSQNSNGIFGETASKTGYDAGVYGLDTTKGATNSGVFGLSTNGVGVNGGSANNYGVQAATGSTASTISAVNLTALVGGDLIRGNGEQNTLFRVDGLGNVRTPGLLYSGGSCSSGCLRSTRVQSYGTTAAVPTIEDTGEARLIAGNATVRIDPAFANAIDARQGYVVLITPEGDTRGLFVAVRTPGAFTVRETMGGRSSIAFGYRIVAHPFGVNEARLPMVQMRAAPSAALPARGRAE
jgi:hypothetical protein